jgi:hypothetical protein
VRSEHDVLSGGEGELERPCRGALALPAEVLELGEAVHELGAATVDELSDGGLHAGVFESANRILFASVPGISRVCTRRAFRGTSGTSDPHNHASGGGRHPRRFTNASNAAGRRTPPRSATGDPRARSAVARLRPRRAPRRAGAGPRRPPPRAGGSRDERRHDRPDRGRCGRCEAQPMRSASDTMIPSGPRT